MGFGGGRRGRIEMEVRLVDPAKLGGSGGIFRISTERILAELAEQRLHCMYRTLYGYFEQNEGLRFWLMLK